MSVDTMDMLLDELKEYGYVLADLIKNNKIRLLENPDNSEYLSGKIDAYEVAYEDFIKRLRKVNSYTSQYNGEHT